MVSMVKRYPLFVIVKSLINCISGCTCRRKGKSSRLSRFMHVSARTGWTNGLYSLFGTFVAGSQCGILGPYVQFLVSYGKICLW